MRTEINRHVNPRKQGDAGLGIAIGWFAANGHVVCVPLTDSQRYDLIVDCGKEVKRVQVKTTTALDRGVYVVSLRTKGGNKSGTTTTHFDPMECELLFLVTGSGDMYLIPTSEVSARATLALGKKYEGYKVQ